MKKVTLLSILILCFSGSVNAQILKKLGKKIEKAAEKTIERKVEQKTKRETEKAFDSTFNKKRKNKRNKGKSGIAKADPAKSYAFKHKVEMQITTGKEVMDIDYYLAKSDAYFGMSINNEEMPGDFMMVYDVSREAMFTFMESAGQKMRMGVSFKTEDDDSESPEFEIKATGNTKTILGYNCKEYKMTGKDITATIWVTKDVDIRFPSTLYSDKKNQNNNQEWMKDLDGWAMEMEMINTAERKPHTIKMKCLSIEGSDYKINSSDYKNIGR
jgi:hypothetical protein